ncbi:hypothetical protein [Sinorhizobium meliloti]|uniref:hypothetical protein n=1 Tax=Rhizobium meliloti TaxID=382 RepID=UPI00398CE190
MSQDAYGRDWELLAEVVFQDLAPIADPESVRVWLTTQADGGLPAGTTIGFSTGAVGGKPVLTCTLAVPDIDTEAFGRLSSPGQTPRRCSRTQPGANQPGLHPLCLQPNNS